MLQRSTRTATSTRATPSLARLSEIGRALCRLRVVIPALAAATLVLAPMAAAETTTPDKLGLHCRDLDPDVSACVYLISWQEQDYTGWHTYYQAWAEEYGPYNKTINQVSIWSEKCINGAPDCPPHQLNSTNPDAAPSGTGTIKWSTPKHLCVGYAIRSNATFNFWSPTYRTWKSASMNSYWKPC